MDPMIAAAMAAGGGVHEAAISGLGQHSTNVFNRRMAREQMAFQERMSSTAYQRAVQDMRKAGINPLYRLGASASTPGGAMSVSQNPLQGIQGTTAKALDARMNAANVKNMEAQNAQILSATAVNVATAKEIAARTKSISLLSEKETKDIFWNDVKKLYQGFKSSAMQVAREAPVAEHGVVGAVHKRHELRTKRALERKYGKGS